MKQPDARDLGTSQRHKHGEIVEVSMESERLKNAKEARECFLDVLYHDGRLRHPEESRPPHDKEARRRHFAGIWLRGVYQKAGIQRRVTMAYTVFGQAQQGEHPEGCNCKECDSINWNWRCWRETMGELGQWGLVCREVCCFDRFPAQGFWDIRAGLDRLANIRGI